MRGDFGYSFSERRPVTDIQTERFPRSMELLTLVLAVLWSIPLGVVSAVRQHRARLHRAAALAAKHVLEKCGDLNRPETADPGEVFAFIFRSDAGSNYGWSDPKVDDLVERAGRETNPARRRQLYHEVQRHTPGRCSGPGDGRVGGGPGSSPRRTSATTVRRRRRTTTSRS